MLHGFSAHKDTWLTVVKVRVILGTVKEPWPVSSCVCVCKTSVPIMFPSTYQSICTSCVWTCPATRGRRAPTPMTTPFTGRSDGFARYSDRESIMCGFIGQAPVCSTEKKRYCSLEFVENVHLNRKPFHLVGTSMGGNVAGVYAACYPADICSMTLICPDGQCRVCVNVYNYTSSILDQLICWPFS